MQGMTHSNLDAINLLKLADRRDRGVRARRACALCSTCLGRAPMKKMRQKFVDHEAGRYESC